MNKVLIGLAAAALSLAAQAGGEHNHADHAALGGLTAGTHYAGRVLGGAVIAGGVTLATENAWAGFAVGTAAGLAYAARGGRDLKGRDALIAAAGAGLGAYGTHLVIAPRFVGYRREF